MTNSVEVGVTHQIKIGRESAWIKVGVTHEYDPDQPGYTMEDAIDDVERVVNRKIIDVIESTVATVTEYEGAK